MSASLVGSEMCIRDSAGAVAVAVAAVVGDVAVVVVLVVLVANVAVVVVCLLYTSDAADDM
eukprot:14479891-Alexandrium_andersonii.AAC.1